MGSGEHSTGKSRSMAHCVRGHASPTSPTYSPTGMRQHAWHRLHSRLHQAAQAGSARSERPPLPRRIPKTGTGCPVNPIGLMLSAVCVERTPGTVETVSATFRRISLYFCGTFSGQQLSGPSSTCECFWRSALGSVHTL